MNEIGDNPLSLGCDVELMLEPFNSANDVADGGAIAIKCLGNTVVALDEGVDIELDMI